MGGWLIHPAVATFTSCSHKRERERETLFAVSDAVRLVKNVMASLCVDRFERQNETIKHATPRGHRATIKCCAPNRGASGRGDLTAPSTSFDFVCVRVCVLDAPLDTATGAR